MIAYVDMAEPSLDFSLVHLFPVVARWNPDRPPAGMPRAAALRFELEDYCACPAFVDPAGNPIDPDVKVENINYLEFVLKPREVK